MGIISVTEKWDEWSGKVNEKGDYEVTRVFMVHTDTKNVGPVEVLNASGVPGSWDDYHAGNDAVTYIYVKDKQAKRDGARPTLWYVTVSYSSDKTTQERKQVQDPLLRPIKKRFQMAKHQKVVDRDLEGTLLQNTAGEFYDPLPEIDDSRPVLVMTRNEAHPWNETLAITYQDAINTDMFLGFEPYQCKIDQIGANEVFENEFHYWEVTYEIHCRREGWRLKTISRGRNERSVDGLSLVPIIDSKTKQAVSDPQLLNEQGYVTYTREEAYEQTFRVYKELAFGPLRLG